MWEAIQYVTSGLTLVAFLAAVGAWIYKSRFDTREKLIASAREDQRAELVARTLEYFDVDTAGLTKEQKYDLAITQIHARSKRFQQAAVVVCFVAVISAVLAGYAISRSDAAVREPPITGETNAAFDACVSKKVAEYQADKTDSIEGGASAPGPGPKGGQKTDVRDVCYSVGPDQQLVAAATSPLSCHGGRCSVTPPVYDNDRRKVCVTTKAWSESKSFGGGGSGKYRLTVTFRNVATAEMVSSFKAMCRVEQ